MVALSVHYTYGDECPHCTRRVCRLPGGRFPRHNYPGKRRRVTGWTDPLNGWRCPMSYRTPAEGPQVDYPARHRGLAG